MAVPHYGATTPPTASFDGQPGVGYMGTTVPPTGASALPYAGGVSHSGAALPAQSAAYPGTLPTTGMGPMVQGSMVPMTAIPGSSTPGLALPGSAVAGSMMGPVPPYSQGISPNYMGIPPESRE